jgi:hypothetical protein
MSFGAKCGTSFTTKGERLQYIFINIHTNSSTDPTEPSIDITSASSRIHGTGKCEQEFIGIPAKFWHIRL